MQLQLQVVYVLKMRHIRPRVEAFFERGSREVSRRRSEWQKKKEKKKRKKKTNILGKRNIFLAFAVPLGFFSPRYSGRSYAQASNIRAATRWSPTGSSTTCSLVVALTLTSDQEEVLESICGGFDGASRHGSPTSARR